MRLDSVVGIVMDFADTHRECVHAPTATVATPPRSSVVMIACKCGHWRLFAGGGRVAQGDDVTAEFTHALEDAAPDANPEDAKAMRGMAKSLRSSGTGWQ